MKSLTSGQYAAATTNPNFFHTKMCRAQPEINTQQSDVVPCLRMSAISYVLNADIGRQADALISYADDLTALFRGDNTNSFIVRGC